MSAAVVLALLATSTASWASSVDVAEASWPGYDVNFVDGSPGVPNAEPVTVKVTLSDQATNFGWLYFEFPADLTVALPGRDRTLNGSGECRSASDELLFTVTANLSSDVFDARECSVYQYTSDGVNVLGFGFGFGDPNISGLTEVTVTIPAGRLLQISPRRDFEFGQVDGRSFLPLAFSVETDTDNSDDEPEESNNSTSSQANKPVAVEPAIHLNLLAAAGKQSAGAAVEIAGMKLQQGSPYTLTVRSTPVVLIQGSVDQSGAVHHTTSLPAGLDAGAHSLTFVAQGEDGLRLTLTQNFLVGPDGVITSIDLPVGYVGQPTVAAESLARTGTSGQSFMVGVVWSVLAVAAGMALLRYRFRSL